MAPPPTLIHFSGTSAKAEAEHQACVHADSVIVQDANPAYVILGAEFPGRRVAGLDDGGRPSRVFLPFPNLVCDRGSPLTT
jgi:hypothetical protein